MTTMTYWVLRDPATGQLKSSNGGKASTPMLYKSEGRANAAASAGESTWLKRGKAWVAVEAKLTLLFGCEVKP